MTDIPIHRLHEQTSLGLFVKYMDLPGDQNNPLGVHRDDHYIFMIQEKGSTRMMIDFQQMETTAGDAFYILPGQVHHGFATSEAAGWFIAVDTALVGQEYRQVFETYLLQQQVLHLNPQQLSDLQTCLHLLRSRCDAQDNFFYRSVIHTLFGSFAGMFAAAFMANAPGNDQPDARPLVITRQFKALLHQHYIQEKSPSAYAGMLHISLSYLNECIKHTTGFSVTWWIQHQVILEAKRLLYYTNKNVKEISFALGYEDNTYFSRLFTKATGSSANQFRHQYRE
jgi:AraC-like DNA-binding protein